MTEDDTTDDDIDDPTDDGIDEPPAAETSDEIDDGDGTGSEPVARSDGGASPTARGDHQYVPTAEIPDSRPARDRDWTAWLRDHAPSLRRTLTYAVAVGVAILWVVPFIGLFMASLRPL